MVVDAFYAKVLDYVAIYVGGPVIAVVCGAGLQVKVGDGSELWASGRCIHRSFLHTSKLAIINSNRCTEVS